MNKRCVILACATGMLMQWLVCFSSGILIGRTSAPVVPDVAAVHINLRVPACRDPLAPPVVSHGVRAVLGELLRLRHDPPDMSPLAHCVDRLSARKTGDDPWRCTLDADEIGP